MEEYLHILEHSFKDSISVFALALIIYIILSFIEDKLTNLLKKNKKTNPIIGSAIGLIPQCGISVVAADLYIKKHITMGTLLAVFFACSDEALPILLSDKDKMVYAIPLLLIKFIVGFILGYVVDLFIDKQQDSKEELETEESHVGCCHHHIEHSDSKVQAHFVHPLLHSLKIFAYVFIVNLVFELIIYWLGGEEVILDFLSSNEYLSPLLSAVVGLIPNCAASVLVTELFILNGIPFAALVSGLCANAGLGIVYLFKRKSNIKDVLLCIGVLYLSSVLVGYITMLIMNMV